MGKHHAPKTMSIICVPCSWGEAGFHPGGGGALTPSVKMPGGDIPPPPFFTYLLKLIAYKSHIILEKQSEFSIFASGRGKEIPASPSLLPPPFVHETLPLCTYT